MTMRLRTRRLLKALREEDGSMLIELAFVMPVFILFIFGVFLFSLALASYIGSSFAVRNAARYASTHSSTSPSPVSSSQLQTMILAGPFVPSTSTIDVSYYQAEASAGGNLPGNAISISLQYTQNISIPFYSKSLTSSTTCYRLIGH